MSPTEREQCAERVVETYSDMLIRIGYTWFGNPYDAQDICQTVLMKRMERTEGFDTSEEEKAWLTAVEVTPIGVTVEIRGDGLKGHHQTYHSGYCIALPEITLYGKDGGVLTPDRDAAPFGVRGGSGCGGGSDRTEEGILRIVQSYGYLLDVEALDHIEVCDVTIPLT